MPLNANDMADDMVAAFDAAFTVPAGQTNIDPATRLAACRVLATAIVDHIQDNALVSGACPPGGGPLSGGVIS